MNTQTCQARGHTPRYLTLGLLALCASLCASAAELEIDPVRIALSTQQKTAVIVIRNNSDQPTTMEAKPVSWSQADSKDVYAATRELLVSPPTFTIPAHGKQTIRTAMRRMADPTRELSYRINLQEIPAAMPPGVTGVQMAIQVGLPVFVKAQRGKTAPKLEWSLARNANGTLAVSLQNTGNAHVQVTDFLIQRPTGAEVLAEQRAATYVLEGQTRVWELTPMSPEKITGGPLRLKAHTDAGDSDKELALELR
jgi:fimbrial chaperone protein